MRAGVSLRDFEAQAVTTLEPAAFDYYAGGSGDELTLAANAAAWRELALWPRVLVDVRERSLATTLLGCPHPHPLVIAPTAFHELATAEAELAAARAAAATETVFCLSSMATTSPADVAAGVPDCRRWFQLYVFRDRGLTRELVRGAVDAGFEALLLTVDVPVLGVRERDRRSGFTAPATTALRGSGGERLTTAQIAALLDPGLTWRDVEQLAEHGLPVVVKGVLRPDDARRAAAHGAAAVVVSNHGGRQLDTAVSTAAALPLVADAVGDELDVLVDGGIRRGTDVVKALALGADAVMIGRPLLWGLAADGERGARRVIELLLGELDGALALVGAAGLEQLDRSLVGLT
jgi:4-hydroxymandelate oxidase